MAAAAPQAAARPPGGEGAEAGREQCWICSDKAVSVRFKPCQHATCEECVNRMRREVVLKADKGLTCPYCRGFVSEYDWIGPEGVPGSKAALREANTAAKAAAAARSGAAKPKASANGNGHAPQPGASAVSGWLCGRCRTRNACSQRFCLSAGCKGVAPSYVQEHLGASAGAIQGADRRTIHLWAQEKLHPKLNPAFEAAGMPFDFHRASLQGTKASVAEAIMAGGHKLLHRVFENVLGSNFIAELAFAFFGSYTLQDLLQAAKRLRVAAGALRFEHWLTPEQAVEAAGGKPDFLSRLASELAPISVRAMPSIQGRCVIKKALAVGEVGEMAALARTGFANAARHLQDSITPGHDAAQLLYLCVPKLRDYASDTRTTRAATAQAALDLFCGSFLQQAMLPRLPRLLSGPHCQVILDGIQGGLPGPSASKLLQAIGAEAQQLSKTTAGLSVLEQLMALRPRNDEAAEELVTHVCVVAQALEGKMADMAADGAEGTALVRCMLRSLARSGEDETCREWAAYITERLVGAAERVSAQPAARSLLAMALAKASDEALPGHVQEVHTRLGAAGTRSLLAELNPEVRGRIQQHLPEPAAAAESLPQPGPTPPGPAPAPAPVAALPPAAAPPSPVASAPTPVPQASLRSVGQQAPAAHGAPPPASPALSGQAGGLDFMSDLLPALPPVQQSQQQQQKQPPQQPLQQPPSLQPQPQQQQAPPPQQPPQQQHPASSPAPAPQAGMGFPAAPLPRAGFPIQSFPARFGPPLPAYQPPPQPPAGYSMPLPAHPPPGGYAGPPPGYQPPAFPAGFGPPQPPYHGPPPAAYASAPPGQLPPRPSFLPPAARPPPSPPHAQPQPPPHAQPQPPPRAAASSAPPPAVSRPPPLSQPAPALAARAPPPSRPAAQPASRPPAPVPPRAAERPQAWAPPAPEQGKPWACAVCTYRHEGAQASFLACDMCGSLRP